MGKKSDLLLVQRSEKCDPLGPENSRARRQAITGQLYVLYIMTLVFQFSDASTSDTLGYPLRYLDLNKRCHFSQHLVVGERLCVSK